VLKFSLARTEEVFQVRSYASMMVIMRMLDMI